jgi:uncharacterized membrane protein
MAEAIRDESGIEAEVRESTGAGAEAAETQTGLDQNVAGALAYLFGFVTGILFYVLEEDNEFVRFHAAQSIALAASAFVLYVGLSVAGAVVSALTFSGSTGAFVAFSVVSLALSLAWLAITLAAFGLWVYLMVRAYQGETPRVPVIGGLADRIR